jgi:Uma2 family endonuclease
MAAEPKAYVSVDDYFAIERQSDERHEYHNGTIVAMVGASLVHNQIQINLIASLKPQLRSNGCSGFGSALRVQARDRRTYCYPDLSVVCGKPELMPFRPDTLVNPVLVIEILSPSTERHDRGQKFAHYRQIASLREYVLIAQDRPMIAHYVRQDSGSWLWSAVEGLTATITFPTIGATVALAEIYDEVAFAPTESVPDEEEQA